MKTMMVPCPTPVSLLAALAVVLGPGALEVEAQTGGSFDIGLGPATHVATTERAPKDILGWAGTLGVAVKRYDGWALDLRFRSARILDDLTRYSRYALTAEARTGLLSDSGFYLVGGGGLGLATVVIRDLDFIGIGDNGGLAATAGAGWIPGGEEGRWALEATLLGHLVPDDVAWTATALVKLRR